MTPERRAVLQQIEISAGRKACILAFSGGKDAITTWLHLRDAAFEVYPYFLYPIPGLDFVEEGIRYAERYFGTEVVRWPHPSLTSMLRNLIYASPEHCSVIEAAKLPKLGFEDIYRAARQKFGELPIAFGVRSADSPLRRLSFIKHGAFRSKNRIAYPIFDMKIEELEATLRRARYRLPVDYELFSRSFDGLDARFTGPIRDRFPADFERIKKFFPLVELDILRRSL